jgi:hypothetical protein
MEKLKRYDFGWVFSNNQKTITVEIFESKPGIGSNGSGEYVRYTDIEQYLPDELKTKAKDFHLPEYGSKFD